MLIRKATTYEAYLIQHWTNYLTEELSNGYMNNNNDANQNMAASIIARGGFYIIAQSESGIVGWLLLGVDRNYYKNEKVGFIYELYVWPYYRNRGIGKQLLSVAINFFNDFGLESVQLNVFAGNPARKIYEKMGFAEVTSLMELKINKHLPTSS